jgi:hypothetical protein
VERSDPKHQTIFRQSAARSWWKKYPEQEKRRFLATHINLLFRKSDKSARVENSEWTFSRK